MHKLLNIDELRSYDVDPHYFGLGFIQLKIKEHERVHFYHNSLPVIAEEPHDHRYSFRSTVLQGTFFQTLYTFERCSDGGYYKHYESCTADKEAPKNVIRGHLNNVAETEHVADTTYNISADTFHTISTQDNCITHLRRNVPHKEFASVIRVPNSEPVCPFSKPIPVKECWELIEDMLPKPGYHLADIQKGTVGEISKILEEVLELDDAHKQSSKIMAQVELSDLYGAINLYMEKYHPDMSFNDLRIMSEITQRAFRNGAR